MPMTPTQARKALERCEPRMPVGEVHEWAQRFGGVTVRELDRALWAYSEANQPKRTR